MLSNRFGFFLTGTRCFDRDYISQIDLWHTDENVQIVIDDKKVILDEDESRIVRRWHELALQISVNDMDDMVIGSRCDRLETIRRAKKLNRAMAARKSRKRVSKRVKVPAAVANLVAA